jgi:hypothetical protein
MTTDSDLLNKQHLVAYMYYTFRPRLHCVVKGRGSEGGVYSQRDVVYSALFRCLAVLTTSDWKEHAE